MKRWTRWNSVPMPDAQTETLARGIIGRSPRARCGWSRSPPRPISLPFSSFSLSIPAWTERDIARARISLRIASFRSSNRSTISIVMSWSMPTLTSTLTIVLTGRFRSPAMAEIRAISSSVNLTDNGFLIWSILCVVASPPIPPRDEIFKKWQKNEICGHVAQNRARSWTLA